MRDTLCKPKTLESLQKNCENCSRKINNVWHVVTTNIIPVLRVKLKCLEVILGQKELLIKTERYESGAQGYIHLTLDVQPF